jgi:uncharacterized protein YbbC (DUF1343 family)
MSKLIHCISSTAVLVIWFTDHSLAADLPRVEPEAAGMSSLRLTEIDQVVDDAIAARQMPGCVMLIARQGKIVFLKAYGHRSLEPIESSMAVDTVFDLASLTKPIATATSLILLVEQGKVALDDPVAKYLPEFAENGKESITVRHLLTHQGGLIADNDIQEYADGPAKSIERVLATKPQAKPGETFVYSDVSYIVLGELVHRVSGQDLDRFAAEHIFQPLGMAETGYLPPDELRQRAAPTEKRDERWMQGEVHDPRAYALGGVAGHAGLFATVEDLAVYAQMILGHGEYGGVRILKPETVADMLRPHEVRGGLRALGWDMRTGFSSNRGTSFSDRAVGHGGFTGTAMWIDPGLDLTVIFLSNRVHPSGKGLVNPLAGRIGTIAAEAIYRDVLTGIDVLVRDRFSLLQGRRIGLITNHTGIDAQGRTTIELLKQAEGVELVALFSPEHGLGGKLDVARIADSREADLPVYSLYGDRRRPTSEQLQGVDTLVFDIQDIGARFYTYISTLGETLVAAAEHKLRFVMLDRPNPINGVDVAGPMLEPGKESFIGFHVLPVRHGMTVGELATLFNAEKNLGADLQVVKIVGWRRGDYFDATGLPWINPSPNMRNLSAALLYPGIGLLETTNLSVGRGTDTPFEVIGAPWLDGSRLARDLNYAGLPGVRFIPIRFTPQSSKFSGEACGGVNILITNRSLFDPLRTGLEIATALRRLYPGSWDVAGYARLLGNDEVLAQVKAGKSAREIERSWKRQLDEFRTRRAKYLLYPP